MRPSPIRWPSIALALALAGCAPPQASVVPDCADRRPSDPARIEGDLSFVPDGMCDGFTERWVDGDMTIRSMLFSKYVYEGPAPEELACVVQVCGDLTIAMDRPDALAGLDQLVDVEGTLSLIEGLGSEDTLGPASLRGLEGLRTVGGLDVGYPGLESLEGLGALEHVRGDVSLPGVPLAGLTSLETVDGDLTVTGSPSLQGPPLRFVGGQLTLRYLASVDLAGLEHLERVIGGVWIHSGELRSLDGLERLAEIGGTLGIHGTSHLRSLGGLASLSRVGGGLDLNNNAKLTSLRGLEGLTEVPHEVKIQWNGSLTSLEGLEGVSEVGSLLVDRNAKLTSLDGLEGLRRIDGTLRIGGRPYTCGVCPTRGNRYLASIDALAGLESVGGELHITRNPHLADLQAIETLDLPSGWMWVQGNRLVGDDTAWAMASELGAHRPIICDNEPIDYTPCPRDSGD